MSEAQAKVDVNISEAQAKVDEIKQLILHHKQKKMLQLNKRKLLLMVKNKLK